MKFERQFFVMIYKKESSGQYYKFIYKKWSALSPVNRVITYSTSVKGTAEKLYLSQCRGLVS